MAKITRVFQKIFGSSAGANQRAVIGSLAAGSPAFSTNPDTIQSLSNYLVGWFNTVVGSNSPAIEDMNSLCFLFAYQLAYLMQAGTAEWDVQTTYYKGSLANNGGGNVYVSLTDANVGNALTNSANWKTVTSPGAADVVVGSAAYCTHATLAAAVADSAVGTNLNVLLTDSQSIAAVVHLTKAGWKIQAMPGVTYTKTGGTTGLSCEANGIEIRGLRMAGWSTGGDKAISGTAAWTYGRVLGCNFNSCDTEIDDSSTVAGKKPITLYNFSEV